MTRIPVLIPARNEAGGISRTLESLPAQAEPIVIPNGCSDQTAEIAEQFGARVLYTDVEGRIPAIQEGIRHLGKKATEPFVILDADSRPVFSKNWLTSLLKERSKIPESDPAIATGSVVFRGSESLFTDFYLTVNAARRYWLTRARPEDGPIYGANMLVHPVKDEVVEELLELTQVWPGSDIAIKDVVIANGGHIRKSVNPNAMIFTDSGRYVGVMRRFKDGLRQTRDNYMETYAKEAPPNALSNDQLRISRSKATS